MRKKALKGYAMVIALLVVCFFFSGTIKTLTTPKVMIVYPVQGRLRENVALTGYLAFSDMFEITLELPITLTVTKVNIVPGMYVQEGTVLLETKLNDIETLISANQQDYTEAQQELLNLEREHSTLRLQRTDEAWLAAYDALVDACEVLHEAQIELEVSTNLRDDTSVAQAVYDQAKQNVEIAMLDMDKAQRVGIAEEVYTYTMQHRALEKRMRDSVEEIVTLRILEHRTQQIFAPHSGYIIDVSVETGQFCTGLVSVLTMSADDASMLLRADTSNCKRVLEMGTGVTILGRFGNSIKSRVKTTGYDEKGNTYVEVALEHQETEALDTIANLMSEGATMQISYVASETAYLLPTSAVRGSGENCYVYSVVKSEDAFGQTIWFVEKQNIVVEDEAGDTVAISGIHDSICIAYMEDRYIAPGSEVMAYD